MNNEKLIKIYLYKPNTLCSGGILMLEQEISDERYLSEFELIDTIRVVEKDWINLSKGKKEYEETYFE